MRWSAAKGEPPVGERMLQFGIRLSTALLMTLALTSFPAPGANSLGRTLFGQNPPPVGQQKSVTLTPYPFPVPGREVTRDLSRALKNLEEGRRLEAMRLLQGMISSPEDFLLPPENVSDPLIDKTLRRQIQQIIARMPRETILEYEVQYGGEAAAKISEARAEDDWTQAGDLSLQYLFTKAGRELTEELALRHLDHGEFVSAGMLFERLLISQRVWGIRSPTSVVLTAYCAIQSDEMQGKQRAQELLEREQLTLESGKISLGGETWELPLSGEQIVTKLTALRIDHVKNEIDQWVLPRQSSVGGSESSVGPPSLVELWSQPTAKWKEALGEEPIFDGDADPRDPLDDFFTRTESRNLPLIPAAAPLIVGDLAIFRTMRQLQGVDLLTGKTRWMSAEVDGSLAAVQKRLSAATQQAGTGRQAMVSALEARVWSNLSLGSLSSDGVRVYSIEGLAVWGNSSSPNNFHEDQAPGERDFNRLIANEIRTGKIAWELGGPGIDSGNSPENAESLRLPGWYFLGPPLPLNHVLYVLAERKRDVHLVALDPVTGNRIWSQTLLVGGEVHFLEYARRCQALTPVAAEGILLCPTGMHALVGLDLTSRSILWGAQIEDPAVAAARAEGVNFRIQAGMIGNRRFQQIFGVNNDLPVVHRWMDPYLQLVGNRILHGPLEGDVLRCLEVRTGKLLWERPRGKGVYVAGERNGRVLIVGRNQVEGVSLDNGQPVWKEPILITAPSGRGYFEGSRYHLPLMNGDLVTIDVEQGMIVARRKYPDEKPLGNLVAAQEMILSQSYDTVSGFKTVLEHALEQGVVAGTIPKDAPGWSLQGLLALYRGEPGNAYGDFKRAWDMGHEPGVRDLWLSSLMEGMRINPQQYRSYLYPADSVMALSSPWGGLWAYQTSRELLRRKDYRGAVELLLLSLEGKSNDAEPDQLQRELSVRREDWVAGRLVEIFQQAPAEAIPELEQLIRREWEKRSGEPRQQRLFQMVVRDLPVGTELASLELAREPERLTLDRELWLLRIMHSGAESQRPQAVAQLARGLLQRGDHLGAVPYLRDLNTKYSRLRCAGELTGKELLDQWGRDTSLKLGGKPKEWPEGKLKVVLRPQAKPEPSSSPSPPLFLDLREPLQPRMQVTRDQERLRAVNPGGDVQWEYPLVKTYRRSSGGKWYYAPIGSMMLMTNAVQLACIDLSRIPQDREADRLWSMELIDAMQIRTYAPHIDSGMFRTMPDRPIQIIDSLGGIGGQLLSCSEEVIVIYRDESLWGLDPLTGKVRWRTASVETIPTVMSWGRKIFANLDPRQPELVSIFSATDGELIELRTWTEPPPPEEVPESSEQPLIRVKRRLDTLPTREGLFQIESLADQRRRLSLVDPETMHVAWQKMIESGCTLSIVEGLTDDDWRHERPSELAIFHPQGKLEIIGFSDGLTRAEITLPEFEQEMPVSFTVIATEECDLVFFRTPTDPGPGTYVHQTAHDKGRPQGRLIYDGTLVAIDRKQNQVKWKRSESRVSAILEVSSAHPVLVIHSDDQEVITQPMENSPPVRPTQRLTLVDRRSGREIHTAKYSPSESTNLTLLRASSDRETGVVSLTLLPKLSAPQQLIEVKYTSEPLGGGTPDILVSEMADIPEIPPAEVPK